MTQYRNETEIATLMLFINTVSQRIATSSSIMKNYRNDPNSRNSKLYIDTVSQRTKIATTNSVLKIIATI